MVNQSISNRSQQLISELSDIVSTCLLDLTDISKPSKGSFQEGLVQDALITEQFNREPVARTHAFADFEDMLRRAVTNNDVAAVQQALLAAEELTKEPDGRTHVARILWKAAIEAPLPLTDLILGSPNSPCDFRFVDDINGRTCIHEAAAAGATRLVDLCVKKGVEVNRRDLYGRTPLHYASIGGHVESCKRLLEENADPSIVDMDNFNCLYYTVVGGHIGCVQTLLDLGGSAARAEGANGINALSLAAQHGHLDVTLLLLEHGSKQVPNTSGEYPIHLAAAAGHAEVCQLLASRAKETLNIADKYNEWTPLFHAAHKGRLEALKVLLQAGSDPTAVDELGRTAVFYAGWYGHVECVSLLLEASTQRTRPLPTATQTTFTPSIPSNDVEIEGLEYSDVDLIPTLFLPPPIMPFRIYGHNYLEKQYLVQITLGSPNTRYDPLNTAYPVKISPWLPHQPSDQLVAHNPLNMVMTSRSEGSQSPLSLTLPLTTDRDTLVFQVQSLSELSLEFSFYPSFGSKAIGRAAVLAAVFEDIKDQKRISLPILDYRLHIVGQVSFDICIVRPFQGVTIQIGGAVETYWKSTTQYLKAIPTTIRQPQGQIGSTNTSPSNRSAIMHPSGTHTVSSLSQEYLHFVVQGTRDVVPVIYSAWNLPVEGFEIGVSDVTAAQFSRISGQVRRDLAEERLCTTPEEWANYLSNVMITLEALLMVCTKSIHRIYTSYLYRQTLPPDIGLMLHVAYPNRSIRQAYCLGNFLDLNIYIESILKIVYQASSTQARRRIAFLSFSPSVCLALNWKQPNCQLHHFLLLEHPNYLRRSSFLRFTLWNA